MGLPMWRDPDEVLAEDAAAKLDRAAAQRRSTIRREASIRPGREQSSSAGLSSIIRHRHQSMLRSRVRLQQEQAEADSQIAHLEAELERLRSQRLRNQIQRIHESASSRAGRDDNDRQHTSDMDDGPVIANDVDTADSAAHGHNDSVLLPRPARESNLRFEVAAPTSTRPASPWRPSSFMPSPPRSSGDENRESAIPDGPLESWETTPPLSQDFAPARAAREELGRSSGSDEVNSDVLRALGDRQGLETPPPESWENTYPPLRRVRHLSPRPLPRVDGLGDRRRSPSPSSETREEENWSNLLATMESGISSTSTSFASMTDLISRSGRSSQNTSTSFGEIGSADDTCDLDLPPGITEEDVREMRARHRRVGNRGRDSPMTGERGTREHRDRVARRVELGMFHAILDRMQRREDVPDDWWAMVGLPPDFARSNLETS